MASIASIEEEKAQYLEQLDVIQSQLKDDADNAELLTLKEELNQMIALLEESLAELKPKQAIPPPAPKAAKAHPPPPTSQRPGARDGYVQPPPPPASYDDARQRPHDALALETAPSPAPADEEQPLTPIAYNVNDTVMAKWVSGDKSFYPARITSITGSSTAPIYIVKFKSYDETETVRPKDIRPMSNKRKADGTPAAITTTSSAPTTTVAPPHPLQSSTTPGVISAAASLYPEAQAARDAEKAGDEAKPSKPKKIKAKKELEAGKAKWQDFNSKSKFGKGKKDSMFRTPEGVHGRVGFTGSGQAMRKDPSRTRHVYQQGEELD
jgi:survival-of-motor-neuron-related-splicing factor 30